MNESRQREREKRHVKPRPRSPQTGNRISRGRVCNRVSFSFSAYSRPPVREMALLLVSCNAAVFNKTLPYSPGHKANINYEGASRGHDAEETVLTGTHGAHCGPTLRVFCPASFVFITLPLCLLRHCFFPSVTSTR